ncbi:MAG: hydrogenase maturation protein HypF [Clostridia bacterium]|nr:hydrogenase maturation protein HypF [Clostridia bacterium]
MAIIDDIDNGVQVKIITKRFHDIIVFMVVIEAACRIRERTGISKVILSGGVFQNRYLNGMIHYFLRKNHFTVFCNRLVPAGDGGIALGQAVVVSYECSYEGKDYSF